MSIQLCYSHCSKKKKKEKKGCIYKKVLFNFNLSLAHIIKSLLNRVHKGTACDK